MWYLIVVIVGIDIDLFVVDVVVFVDLGEGVGDGLVVGGVDVGCVVWVIFEMVDCDLCLCVGCKGGEVECKWGGV